MPAVTTVRPTMHGYLHARVLTCHQAYVQSTVAALLAQVVGRVIKVHMPSNTSANMQTVNGITAAPTQPTQQRPAHIAWEYHTRAYRTGMVDMPELLHSNHYVAVSAPANDVLGEMIGPAAGPEYTLTHAAHMHVAY